MRAQSLDAGSLNGAVRDSAARDLPEASVTLTDRVTGVARIRMTPRDGRYAFSLLLPGEYDLLVERFGYRPRLILGVPVRAGSEIRLDVVLRAIADRPGIDTTTYPGAPSGGVHLPLNGDGADDRLAALTQRTALFVGAADLLPGATRDLQAEGLPGRLGALALDGVARWSPRHPRLASAWLDGIAFPLAAVHGVELLPGGVDAEWSSAGGGLLSGFTVPGSRRLSATLTAAGGPDAQMGSLVVGGPAVRDTAHFVFGVFASRTNPKLAAPWPYDSLAAGIAATALDSFQTDLGAYQRDWKPVTTILSGFGRFDWILARDHRIAVRADAATATLHDPVLADDVPATLGSSLTARDLSVAALVTSTIGAQFGSEFRVSVDAGNRDYTAAPLGAISTAGTTFTEGGFSAGSADIEPGTFKRTTIRLGETIHYRLGFGVLKAGLQFGFNNFEQSHAEGRGGMFFFGDSVGFVDTVGAFRQTVGSLPLATFKTSVIGGFFQALLRPTPTLEILLGMRYEQEKFPVEEIRLNSEWRRLTGIDNREVTGRRALASPRFAFTWTPDAARRWQVVTEAGRFVEASDPGEFAEAITHASGTSVRRAFGSLGSWPRVPDSTVAPVRGQSLTLLGSQFAPPQTSRVRFAITGNLGGTLMRLQFAYRHTDYLPIRRDLNLPVATNAHDQDGRVIYGTLSKAGTLVVATPGTNRRFSAFDAVSTLDPAGASDYYGVTFGLQRFVSRGISLMFTYTYSRTTDNWFGARASSAEAQFVPLFDTTGAAPWAQGRSDFDTPHRLVVGTEIRLRGSARLALLYRWHSGYPFTPGFRDGVDVNGDGSGRNDPAFVMDTIPGATDVVNGNACLRSQVGRFADRNSCREKSAGQLDLRFSIGLHRNTELMLDALGLVATGQDVTDHALYLVDRSVPLVTSPAGVTTIPLLGNPNFGKVLVKRTPGATIRVGIRVGL